ncbi:MAG: polymer-forming cytoskeletal protein [Litorilinea sp.]
MKQKLMRGRPRRAWLMGMAMVVVCLSLLGLALPSQTALAQSNRLFQGDLRVESGQVIAGDTVVYDGDVWIEPEGRITGNLVVFNGDVDIEPGGTVGGNVDLFSGDITVSGTIDGNLALWSGDATLRDAARVGGDINVLAGEIARAPGATVGGRVLEGPNLGLTPPQVPTPFGFGFRDGGPRATDAAVSGPLIVIQWVGMLLVRLLGALLFTAFVAVVVGLTVHVRPDAVATVRKRMVEKSAMSFVVGLASNLILVFLGGLLAATVCLLPIALAPMLVLLAMNLLGWAALAQMVGARLESYTVRPMESWMWAGAGAVLITGGFALLWAFGGVFRFMGGTVLLFVASFGAGAVLLPWVMRVLKPKRTGKVVDSQPVEPVSADSVTPVADGAAGAQAGAILPEQVEKQIARMIWEGGPLADIDAVGESAGDVPADSESVAVEPDTVATEDDFMQLKGVGPVIDGRLKDAGIRTYAQLAALSYAEIGEIVGWSATRVQRSEIVEQAKAAAD